MCRVACPVLDEFSSGIHCLHLCVMVGVVCMLVQQLSYLEDLSGSKAELTLVFGAIIVGGFSFVAVVYGALGIVLVVVVIVALSISVGLLVVSSFIDFHGCLKNFKFSSVFCHSVPLVGSCGLIEAFLLIQQFAVLPIIP